MVEAEQWNVPEDHFSRVAEAEVDLVGGDNLRMVLEDFNRHPNGNARIAELADDLTSLLMAAFGLWAIVGKADFRCDPGQYHLPSTMLFGRNFRPQHWAILIDLLWQGWTYIDGHSYGTSRRLVERWLTINYPTFQRMALEAIVQSTHWDVNEKLEALLKDAPLQPLWSMPLQKVVLDLIVLLWASLD